MQTQNDFYEIYDYFSQPLIERTSFKIAVAILILCLISLLVYVFFKRKQKPISVWDWAIKELFQLKPERCTSKSEYKIFYFKLTGILKTYLNKRFGWHTENKTDEELISYIRKQNFDFELTLQLEKTLQGASWIKFANEDALKNQAETDFKTVKDVIEKTKIQNEAKSL